MSKIGNLIQKQYKTGYHQGRSDAERDFQNSDYWNDYLAKVIKDTRTDTINECIKFVEDWDGVVAYALKEHMLKEE